MISIRIHIINKTIPQLIAIFDPLIIFSDPISIETELNQNTIELVKNSNEPRRRLYLFNPVSNTVTIEKNKIKLDKVIK